MCDGNTPLKENEGIAVIIDGRSEYRIVAPKLKLLHRILEAMTNSPAIGIPSGSHNLICPDCGERLVKSSIECHDGSGWMCGYLCGCKVDEEKINEV